MSHIVPMSESSRPAEEPEQPIPQQEGQECLSVQVSQERQEGQEIPAMKLSSEDAAETPVVPLEASPASSRHSSGHQCRVNVSWKRTQGRSYLSYFKKCQSAAPSSSAPSPVPDESLSPEESLLPEAFLSPDASLSLDPSRNPSLDSHPSPAPSPSLWEWAPDAFKKTSPSASEEQVASPTPTSWRATAEPAHCSSALPAFTAPKSSFKDAPACRLYVPPAVREFVAEQLREQQQQREQGPPKPLSWRAVARPAPKTDVEAARRSEPKKDEDTAAKKFHKGRTNSVSTATELKTAKIRGREFYNSMLTKSTKPDSSSSSRKLSWSSYLSRRRQMATHAPAMTQQGITPPPKKPRKQPPAGWRVHPEEPRDDVEVPLFQNPDFHLKTDKSTDEEIALIYRHLDSLGEAMINHIEQGLYDDLRRQASASDQLGREAEEQYKLQQQQQQQQRQEQLELHQMQMQQMQMQQMQMQQMQMQQMQMQQQAPQPYQQQIPQMYQQFQNQPSQQDQRQQDLRQLHLLEQQMQHLRMQEQELQHRLMQDQQYRDYRLQDQQMKHLEIPEDQLEMQCRLMQHLQTQTQTQTQQPIISTEPSSQPQFLPQPQIHDQMLTQLQMPDPQSQQPADPQQIYQFQMQQHLFQPQPQPQPQPIQEPALQPLPVQQQQLHELHMQQQQQQLQMQEQHMQQQQSLLDPSVPSPLTYAPQATLAALYSPNDPATDAQTGQAAQNPRIHSLQAMLTPSPRPEWGQRFRPEQNGDGQSKPSRFFPQQDLDQHGDGPGQDSFLARAAERSQKGGARSFEPKSVAGKPPASAMAGDGNDAADKVFVRAVGDPYYRSPGASKASPVKPESFPYLKALKQAKENQQAPPSSWRSQAPPPPPAAPAQDNVAKVPFRTTARKQDAPQPRFNQYAGNKTGPTSSYGYNAAQVAANNGRNKVPEGTRPKSYKGAINGPKKGQKDPKEKAVASGQSAGAANQGQRIRNKGGKSSRRVDSQGFVLIGGEGRKMPHLEPADRAGDMGNQFNLLDDNDC
ncbi:uncharacterized protein Dana_GF21102 [Drosophila ananassae]|uniref:Uncharacterized protein n=1 Tax=Drosophila ananassae TaxID=7217 RepID=B3MQY1_DROAN|nr:uncharacterized protein Dana_GF21102 [Drosophila ananassae]